MWKKLALNVKKNIFDTTPPFWTPGCPEGSPKEGKNGSRRDAGRTVEYFHVVPLAKMWQIVRGRWWKKITPPPFWNPWGRGRGRKGAPKVGKTGPGGILREPFNIFMWFLLEKCGKWWGEDDEKNIPIPGPEAAELVGYFETGPTTFHDLRSERFLGFAHGLVYNGRV